MQHFLDYITEMQSKEEYPITDLLHVYMAFSVQRLPQCMYTLCLSSCLTRSLPLTCFPLYVKRYCFGVRVISIMLI